MYHCQVGLFQGLTVDGGKGSCVLLHSHSTNLDHLQSHGATRSSSRLVHTFVFSTLFAFPPNLRSSRDSGPLNKIVRLSRPDRSHHRRLSVHSSAHLKGHS